MLGGDGPPIEYAVRMRRFPQEAPLDSMARNGTLPAACMDALVKSALAAIQWHRQNRG